MIDKFNDLIEPGSEEEILLTKIDWKKIPTHLAIIMDGNGRWAKQQGLNREAGHRKGAEIAKNVTGYALRSGIRYLTLFAFSSENWKRPATEVNMLMNMLYDKLVDEKQMLIDNQIKLQLVGELGRLPKKLKDKVFETEEYTKKHRNLQLNLAINYGGRMEIVNAVKKILAAGISASKINEKSFAKYLYTADCPDPDLLVRTSGEQRISNFLLYQAAYAELVFTPVMWPDFNLKAFLLALLDFQGRARRFGKL